MEEEAQNTQKTPKTQVDNGNTVDTEEKEDPSLISRNKKGRIIIRNLIFDVNEKHLRKLFSKYGEIIDIKIPVNPATNKSKGFAFVEFDNKNTAFKVINELNDTKFQGRNIFLDFSVEKSRYEANKPTAAVKEAQAKAKENKKKSEDDDDDIEQEGEGEEDDEENDEDFEDDDEEEEDDEEAEEGEEVEEEEEKEEKKEDYGATIFVRNISYEVGESEFRAFFKKFGQLDYAKLVMNRETETHNGCGFIKFKDAEVAKYIIEQSKKYEGTNPLRGDSGVIADVNFELGGRRMIVLPALGKKEVTQVKEERQKKFDENAPRDKNSIDYWIYQDKQKKRRLYLTKFGLNDPEVVTSEEDKEKFTANLQEKVEKLKNPNHFVSETRVILKNLPKKMFDEDDLKKIVLELLGQKHNAKIIKTRRLVSRVLIVREKDRVDEDGHLRSRGYGFVDFVSSDDALFFLDKIKDNYKMINKQRTPIVEFAIEDIREIQKREKILAKLQAKYENDKREKGKDGEEKPKFKAMTLEEKNAEKLAKLKLDKLLEAANQGSLSEVKLLMKKIKSRGLKQRFQKKISKTFQIREKKKEVSTADNKKLNNSVKTMLQAKKDKKDKEKNKVVENNNKKAGKAAAAEKTEKTKPEKPIKLITEDATEEEEAKLVKSLQRMIKNNKKSKRRAEDHDEFDDIADAYKKKINKH